MLKNPAMKKVRLLLAGGFVFLTGCNELPEAVPAGNLSVYPNPAVDGATIRVVNQINSAFLLKVFDPAGKLIQEEKGAINQRYFQLPLSGKPKGKYQVILEQNQKISTVSLIKI